MKKNFYLDLVIFIACLACLITGLMLDFHLFEGGREVRHYWRDIHASDCRQIWQRVIHTRCHIFAL